MHKTLFLTVSLLAAATLSSAQEVKKMNEELLQKIEQETLIPIAPGGVNGSPFWNQHAVAFLYAPSFDFAKVSGSQSYRFTVKDSKNQTHVFHAELPTASLSPVWLELPVGGTEVLVEGISASGEVCGIAGKREFYRNAPFKGVAREALLPYRESAFKALSYIFHKDFVQDFLKRDEPDHAKYELFCYPSKILGALADGMLLYAKLQPEGKERNDAMIIARKALDYLLSISGRPGTPLEFMPPTYQGTALTANDYAGMNMMCYPAYAAEVYLNFYDATGERKFYDAALRIAGSYARLQLPCGSWYLKLYEKDGTPVKKNIMLPSNVINFLARLEKQYGVVTWRKNRERALAYLRENFVEKFDWEGQFEDSALVESYKNLTMHTACDYALYLLEYAADDPETLPTVLEIARFTEDQFIIWSDPLPSPRTPSNEWIVPCGLEQYSYYVPIDTAAMKAALLFEWIYRKTGNKLMHEKSLALANTMTHAQDQVTGRYFTYWENNARGKQEGWINCAICDARYMLQLAGVKMGNSSFE